MRVIAGVRSGFVMMALALLALAPDAAAQSLERKIQSALNSARLGTARVAVSVYDVDQKRELAAINADGASAERSFIPASNLKLLTSGAALATLGADFEFLTTLIQDGDTLVIRGMGDPGLADPELLAQMGADLNTLLDRLVAMARQSGAKGIREIVLDDRVFDRELVHPDWPRDQLHLAYCAPVSGLNFHANVLNVYVQPARSQPEAPWITVKRVTRKVDKGNTELRLDRERDGPFSFKLSGAIRYAPDFPVQVTVRDSATIFGRLIADRLIRDGLTAPGLTVDTLTIRLAAPDERTGDGPGARTLAVVRTPIATVLERCNVDSDNLYAESLLKIAGHKATGQPGSWANGVAVVRMQVRDRLGSEYASRLIMSDGSGLSRNNRVTAGMLTRWLASLASDPELGPVFVESLPTVGEGTLKKRFKGTKLHCEVRGKSGYIRQVRTLSGLVTEPLTGRRVAYSVLINDIPPDADKQSKDFHETVVTLIDDHLAGDAGLNQAKRKGRDGGPPPERIGG